jgi:hypothetical protein
MKEKKLCFGANPKEVIRRIIEEDDFVYCNKYCNSIKKLVARYPYGAPIRLIANALLMTEEEVEGIYQEIIKKLRTVLLPSE